MSVDRSLLLVGTGLIGGSFALAAKASGIFGHVAGMDRNPEASQAALALGIIDEAVESVASGYDAICVAVPVGGIAACVREAAAHAGRTHADREAPLVFDVGSVKAPVIQALDPLPAFFVPCHPVAGSERQGPTAARADLFDGQTVVLTPTAATAPAAIAAVRGFWEAVGGRVVVESAARHDERFALLSHLPHLVAFAFMEVAGRVGPLDGAGGGFRDFTRIAAADAQVWADILCANAPRVRRYVDQLIDDLRGFAQAAEAAQNGSTALRTRIEAAARVKRAFDEAG